MTQSELIAALSIRRGILKTEAADFLDMLAEEVDRALRVGGEIVLPGIGKLSVKRRAASSGRNPRTGEQIQIAAKTVVAFRPAKSLRDAVNPPAPQRSIPRQVAGLR